MSPLLIPSLCIPLLLSFFATVPRPKWVSGTVILTVLASFVALPVAFMTDTPDRTHALIRLTPVSAVMMVLVSVIGWVVLRYSNNYLAGEPRTPAYRRWLLLILAAVNLVLLSNHLLLLLAGWVGISLALHQLLMFYPDRPRAALAAHKKFLLARSAESLLLIAALLLYQHHGTFQIDRILAAYPSSSLSLAEQTAAVLLVLVALIKCAQLPVHGWLIQVVEAPTPVSALLHAGVVNLGGYLLLLFAPLLEQAAPARWLVLLVAGGTLVLASLIMLTRVSVKVRLAWSTSAQMALMLIECALGLYELALLHLVAHSCYKAHAFLSAGSAVNDHLRQQLVPAARPSALDWALAGLFSTVLAATMAWSLNSAWISPWVLLALALTQWLAVHRAPSSSHISRFVPVAIALAMLYTTLKWFFGTGIVAPAITVPVLADLWIAVLWLVVFAGQWFWQYSPDTVARQRFHRWLFSGLYLDEWVTRVTLAVWPTELPERVRAKQHATLTEEPSV